MSEPDGSPQDSSSSLGSPRSPYGPCPAVCKWRDSPECLPLGQAAQPPSPMHELGTLIRRFSAPAMVLPPAMDQVVARPAPASSPANHAVPVRQLRDGAFVVRKPRLDPIITPGMRNQSVDEGRTPSSILHNFFDF